MMEGQDITPDMVRLSPSEIILNQSQGIVDNFEKIEKYWKEMNKKTSVMSAQLTLSLIVNIILALLALRR